MLRLSKRAWNNVLIFSMIALILILNLDQFSQEEASTRLIVPEGEYILSVSINGLKIEKAGPQWRVSSSGIQANENISQTQLSNIIDAWQRAYISPVSTEFSTEVFGQPDIIAVLQLAGVSKQTVVAFNIVQEELFLVIDKQVYILNSPNVAQLLEPVVTVTQ